MVRGLINILYRSGGVSMVDGVAVREKDDFDYERGITPRIFHKPYMGLDDAGAVVASYAVIRLTNGEVKLEVMNARDLAKVREMGKSSDAWAKWDDQFCIKAVIKRAYKQLPTTPQLDQVIQHDNMNFDLEQAKPEPIKVVAKAGQPSRLQAIINHAQEPIVQTVTRAQPVAEPVYFGDDGPPLEECPPYDR